MNYRVLVFLSMTIMYSLNCFGQIDLTKLMNKEWYFTRTINSGGNDIDFSDIMSFAKIDGQIFINELRVCHFKGVKRHWKENVGARLASEVSINTKGLMTSRESVERKNVSYFGSPTDRMCGIIRGPHQKYELKLDKDSSGTDILVVSQERKDKHADGTTTTKTVTEKFKIFTDQFEWTEYFKNSPESWCNIKMGPGMICGPSCICISTGTHGGVTGTEFP